MNASTLPVRADGIGHADNVRIRSSRSRTRPRLGRDFTGELTPKPSFQRTKCSVDFFDLTPRTTLVDADSLIACLPGD